MHIKDIQIRDPFVVVEEGAYYLFGSTDKDIWKGPGTGFDVYRSNGSLTDFEGPFSAFRPPANFWSETNFWAPEVHRCSGSYYMFATFKPKEGSGQYCRGTAILKSESGIMGPYQPWSLNAAGVSGPVTPPDWECLDGTLYIEESGAGSPQGEGSAKKPQPYLVFCHEWQQLGDGQICALPLTGDLRQAAGEPQAAPRILFRASEAAWAYEYKGRTANGYVTDGPFMHRTKDGALLMLWSSFGKEGNYCIGTARSETGTLAGPWVQSEKPLYSADGGHGMFFRGKEGALYLAVHTPNKTPFERAIFVEVNETGSKISKA